MNPLEMSPHDLGIFVEGAGVGFAVAVIILVLYLLREGW